MPAEGIDVDTLVSASAEGISVRTEPTTAAERIASLAGGERVYVVAGPVEADGYSWYLVAPGEDRAATDCSDPQSAALACAEELGWAASASREGDPWMEPVALECPSELGTEAYLALEATERLACAGDAPWRLLAFLAPETQGRGCFPAWTVDPFWMDASCSLFFPQAVESRFDSDTRIQGFIPPAFGECDADGCPFDAMKGSWVEITGHLDDPIAEACTTVPNPSIDEPPPSPPNGPQLTIFSCRLNFVVDEVVQADPPADS